VEREGSSRFSIFGDAKMKSAAGGGGVALKAKVAGKLSGGGKKKRRVICARSESDSRKNKGSEDK